MKNKIKSLHSYYYRITLADGRTVKCSEEHRWLCNRGWKYTIGEEQGENRRPFLTKNNVIVGIDGYESTYHQENELYKIGYVAGIWRGDGTLGIYKYGNKVTYSSRMTMRDAEAVERCSRYMKELGLETRDFVFKNDGEEWSAVGTKNSRESFEKLCDVVNVNSESYDFARGFVAGMYDSEGSTDKYIKRIANSDLDLLAITEEMIRRIGIDCVCEKHSSKGRKNDIYSLRIIGGLEASQRLFNIIKPAVTRKWSIDGIAIKSFNNESRKVVSVERVDEPIEMYDLTTSTENFIANGLVSHNCYAKSLLDFRNLWNEKEPSIADIKKIENRIKKLDKGTVVRLGGMTDCFQPIEEEFGITYETIKLLNKYGIEYLIVTKSDMVANDAYMSILDGKLAHIQITITFAPCEKAVSMDRRIKAVEKLYEAGYDVAVRLSPFIPQFAEANIDKINGIKCDKIIVEFLRINHWIEKWLPLDYSDYTVKHAGYKHLPLDKKIILLSKITGFDEISVCEDVDEHYQYWKEAVNYNKDDCCNLRRVSNER